MTGHGHVTPNPDGSKARCGGPGLCAACSREAQSLYKPRHPPGHNERAALLGKQVTVKLGDHHIATGQLLGFGDGGDFEILADDGFVHYCWPMLEIREADK